MINPNAADDYRSLNSTIYSVDRSTNNKTTSNDANSNRNSYSGHSSKSSWGKTNRTDLLLKLFWQRDEWRKYGKLKDFCNGTFVIAPVKLWWWMAEIFTLLTVLVFAYEFFFVKWIILIPAVILAILEWMAFYKTCFRDPGVMPRPEYLEALKNLVSVLSTWHGGPGTKRVVAHPNGQQEDLFYCWRCHHFRSNHTTHCGTCDCCMMVQDHHCPVYGGCVAKNNTSSFHTMIITMALFWVYMLGICIFNMTAPNVSVNANIPKAQSTKTENSGLTFYTIMTEITLVFVVPLLVSCVKELCYKPFRKADEVPEPTRSKEICNKVLKFVQDNNFNLQEVMQLKEILQIEDDSPDDFLNHNHNVYPATSFSA